MLIAIVASPAFAKLDFPALTGRVVDQADIIPADVETSLTAKLAAFEQKTTDQLVVVTLNSLGGTDIADYGYQLGRFWAIGQKDKNNGAILIVAPNERAVRIEVGYGLEGDLTDAVSRLIIENAILPRFKAGDMPGGIERGVDDIIQVLSGDAAAFKERAAERSAGGSQSWLGMLPFLIFLAIFIFILVRQIRHPGRRRGPWGWTTGPGWSSGSGSGWSSGGSSGGGFSGGGGSFGGGGSSGHW